MALETATYVSDLVVTNPTASDPKSQGDDHLRLEKSVFKNSFPNVSGAVTATHTQLSNGQPTNGTSVASTSGTSIDFTSIPSWVKRITVGLSAVSLNSSAALMIQLGDSGGIETSGYNGANQFAGTGAGLANAAGFSTGAAVAAVDAAYGAFVLTLIDAATNTWTCVGMVGTPSGAQVLSIAGSKSTSATLDRVRITSVGGTATFDAGIVNIQYD